MKNIFLFCCQNREVSANLAQLLYQQQGHTTIINPQTINSIYTECRNHLSCDQALCFYSAFNIWVQAIQPFFSAAITQEILNGYNADIIIISPENYQFISCWRNLCALRNDKLRVIHIRNFSWLHGQQDDDARQEFQSAVHVALQADTDTYCFSKEDLEILGDTAAQWLMGRNGIPHPALFLTKKTPQKNINDNFPREIQQINTLFAGASLGSKFVLDINTFSSDDLKYLKSAAHPASALELYWQNKGCLPNESLSFVRTEQRMLSLLQELQLTRKEASRLDRLRDELDACSTEFLSPEDLRAFLDGAPFKSIPQTEILARFSAAEAAPRKIKKHSEQQPIVREATPSPNISTPTVLKEKIQKEKIQSAPANSLLRKFRKLKRDPQAFFKDSNIVFLRLFQKGALRRRYMKLKKDPRAFFRDSKSPFVRFLGKLIQKNN